ncbi:MAG: NAD(P)H-binding protein [Chloroherpetonaceae bacterium]|nr:NAD(P)H-binding protein [Chloroherpetonaceae bacterium]
MIVILGATGNTGKPLAEMLLKAGEKVTVVGRDASKLEGLRTLGAKVETGSIDDAGFLSKVFTGATAIYALVPPNFTASNFRAYQNQVIDAIKAAIESAKVKYVVTLSSIGAHLPSGTGVVNGLNDMERKFNELKDSHIVHLRAGFFMQNIFGMLGAYKQAGVLGGFPIRADLKIPMIHTNDISKVAFDFLSKRDFEGKSFVNVAHPQYFTLQEVASKLGQAIQKPDLKYVQFEEAAFKGAMLGMGASESLVDGYLEFSKAMNERETEFMSGYQLTSRGEGKISVGEFIENELSHAAR